MRRAGSSSRRMPRPVHAGQAPCGELKEKRAGLQLVDRGAVERAAVSLGVALLLERAGIRGRHDHDALAQAQGGLHGIRESRCIRVGVVGAERPAFLVRVVHDQPIDDDLDRVALVLVQVGRLVQVVELAVHAHAHEPLLAGRLEDAIALRLAVLDERTQHQQPRRRPAAPGCGPRSAARSCARSRGRRQGSADGRHARTAAAGGRTPP